MCAYVDEGQSAHGVACINRLGIFDNTHVDKSAKGSSGKVIHK